MPDNKPTPAIPAWQRARQAGEKASEETSDDTNPAHHAAAAPAEDSAAADAQTDSTEEQPASPIAQSESTKPSLHTGDFETFRQQQGQPQQPPAVATTSVAPRPVGPPIITYPEYLVEAHKPPPLITLSRLWTTAKIASGAAALIYGASKYLVTPMSDSLNAARHDFALHSQGKMDEFNERLAKLVSKVPEEKKSTPNSELEETDSEVSDPTDLYHRDMGTQTSPPPSRLNSISRTAPGADKTKTPTEYQTQGLTIIKEHLSEMLDRFTDLEVPEADRQAKVNELRTYLDMLMYASTGISAWSTAEDVGKTGEEAGGKEDGIEELKKEIRGVKGVMLSAKRFPGVAGRVT